MARPSLIVALPVAAFVALAAVFAVGMFREDPDALPSTMEGAPAPDLDLTSIGGTEPFTRAALTEPGVKLVNYWASWCVPCRAEHPVLERLAAEGIPIYGINYKDEEADALAFLDELGNPYTAIGADATGRNAIEWGVYGVPETYVIDGDGTVLLRYAGPIMPDVVETRIRPAIEAARSR